MLGNCVKNVFEILSKIVSKELEGSKRYL